MFKWARVRVGQVFGNHTMVLPVAQLSVMAVEQHPAREVIRHLVAISSAVCPLVAAAAASPLNHPSVCTPRLARRPGVHARWKQQNRVPVHHAGSLSADLAHRQR